MTSTTPPQIVDIEKEIQKGNTVNKFFRFSTLEENVKIQLLFNVLGLPAEFDGLQDMLKHNNYHVLNRYLIQYAVRHGYVDYTKTWYRWFKRKINEFNYRYVGRTLIYQDTIIAYKNLLKLFIQVSVEFNILTSNNAGNELSYFIASQYASKYSLTQGLLAPINVSTFLYKDNYTNYRTLLEHDFPASLIQGSDYNIHIDKSRIDKTLNKSLRKLKDHEFAPYVNIAVPIIQGKIPRLTKKTAEWLSAYIHAIEILIVREELFNRHYNKFLLSIEHLRVHTKIIQLRKKEPWGASG